MKKYQEADKTLTRKQLILHLHEKLLNNSEIAKRVGCSRENVRQVLDMFNLKSHYGKTKEECGALDYSTGMSLE